MCKVSKVCNERCTNQPNLPALLRHSLTVLQLTETTLPVTLHSNWWLFRSIEEKWFALKDEIGSSTCVNRCSLFTSMACDPVACYSLRSNHWLSRFKIWFHKRQPVQHPFLVRTIENRTNWHLLHSLKGVPLKRTNTDSIDPSNCANRFVLSFLYVVSSYVHQATYEHIRWFTAHRHHQTPRNVIQPVCDN